MDVVNKKRDLVSKFILSGFGELLEILFKDLCAKDFHFIRSERKASADLNDMESDSAIVNSRLAIVFLVVQSNIQFEIY